MIECPICHVPLLPSALGRLGWLDLRDGLRYCLDHLPPGLDEYLATLGDLRPPNPAAQEHGTYKDTL